MDKRLILSTTTYLRSQKLEENTILCKLRHIFRQQINHQLVTKHIKLVAKSKGLSASFLKFLDTCLRTKSSHGHCQHECIYLIDPIYNRMRKQVERI